jgi:hypothetical protein
VIFISPQPTIPHHTTVTTSIYCTITDQLSRFFTITKEHNVNNYFPKVSRAERRALERAQKKDQKKALKEAKRQMRGENNEETYEQIAQELQDSLPNGCQLMATRDLEDMVITYDKDCIRDEATMRSVQRAIDQAYAKAALKKSTQKSK